jgi:hypothetical protein
MEGISYHRTQKIPPFEGLSMKRVRERSVVTKDLNIRNIRTKMAPKDLSGDLKILRKTP